jgi:hypothetical protein
MLRNAIIIINRRMFRNKSSTSNSNGVAAAFASNGGGFGSSLNSKGSSMKHRMNDKGSFKLSNNSGSKRLQNKMSVNVDEDVDEIMRREESE